MSPNDSPPPGIHPSPRELAEFRARVLAYSTANPRPLPWRGTRDPYAILVSEIMLQQTQVDRVRPRYESFLARFPDLVTLAAAPLHEVLTEWQGLGYNRRAVSLHRCAGEAVSSHGGTLPHSIEGLQALPGIGPYTARAIEAFAFDVPSPFIETNIRTVFIHEFFHDQEGVRDREILPLVEATLDRQDPRTWYYALMDYGVMLKKEHVNPGRRSAHHSRQSPFLGSNRQLRSRMLKTLLQMPGLSAGELAYCASADEAAVRRNLEQMVKEGLLKQAGDRFVAG